MSLISKSARVLANHTESYLPKLECTRVISRHNRAPLASDSVLRKEWVSLFRQGSQISLACHSSNTSEHYRFILTFFDDPERLKAGGH